MFLFLFWGVNGWVCEWLWCGCFSGSDLFGVWKRRGSGFGACCACVMRVVWCFIARNSGDCIWAMEWP